MAPRFGFRKKGKEAVASLFRRKPETAKTPPASVSSVSIAQAATNPETPALSSEAATGSPPIGDSPLPGPSLSTQELRPQTLWDEAFDSLALDEPELVAKYIELLKIELPGGEKGSQALSRHEALDQISELGLQHMKDTTMQVSLGTIKFTPQDSIAKAAAAIQWAKDFLKEATSNVPYTSVVWAAVSLILPLLQNPSAEDKASRSGLIDVTESMDKFIALETTLLPQSTRVEARPMIRSQIRDFYKAVLGYQMKCILYYYRSGTKNMFRAFVKYDDFSTAKTEIDRKYELVLRDLAVALSGTQVAVQERLLAEVQNGNELQKQKMEHELSQEQKQCLRDLCLTDPENEAKRIKATKGGLLSECADWMFAHERYRRWKEEGACQVLWLNGGPGKGKTMLMLRMAEELRKEFRGPLSDGLPSDARVLIAYHFCQATDSRLSTATSVLRSLLYQLVRSDPALIKHVQDQYDVQGVRMFEDATAVHTLLGILEAMLSDLAEQGQRNDGCRAIVYLLVDALDECLSDRQLLLSFISQTAQSRSPGGVVRWLVSSRVDLDIQDSLAHLSLADGSSCSTSLNLDTSTDSVETAIATFIRDRVSGLPVLRSLQQEKREQLQGELVSKLSARAEGTFLWVALAIDQLKGIRFTGSLADAIRKTVEDLPKGLEAFYTRMLEQLQIMEGDDQTMCKDVLATASLAKTPLTLLELKLLVYPQGDLKDMEVLIDLCGSFLVTRDDRVYFFHQSAKDYVTKSAAGYLFPEGTPTAHFILCERLLNSLHQVLRRDVCDVKDPAFSIKKIEELRTDSLTPVTYASLHWVEHFCLSGEMSTTSSSHWTKWTHAQTDDGIIFGFLREHFLHWAEACALLGRYTELLHSTLRLSHSIQSSASPRGQRLVQLLSDAERYLPHFRHLVEEFPLQLYASALVFCPSETEIRRLFWDQRLPFIRTVHGGTPRNWQEEKIYNILELRSSSLSPNGNYLAACAEEKIIVWEDDTGRLVFQSTQGRDAEKIFWAESETLCLLYNTREEGISLSLVNIVSGEERQVRLQGGTEYAMEDTANASSLDGRLVASGAMGSIKIWDVETGTQLHRLSLRAHDMEVTDIHFSADGNYLAAADFDQERFVVFSTSSEKPLLVGQFRLPWGFERIAAFIPNTCRMAFLDRQNIYVVNALKPDDIVTIRPKLGAEERLACISNDGKYVVSYTRTGHARLWNVATCTVEYELYIPSKPTRLHRPTTPGPMSLLCESYNSILVRRVKLTDTPSQLQTQPISDLAAQHKRNYDDYSPVLSHDGQWLAYWELDSNDDTVPLMIVGLEQYVAPRTISQVLLIRPSRFISFSPNSQWLAAIPTKNELCVWEARTGNMLFAHKSKGRYTAEAMIWYGFSGDSSFFLFRPRARKLCAIRTDLWETAWERSLRSEYYGDTAVSADGAYIAMQTARDKIAVVGLKQGTVLHELDLMYGVDDIYFSADSQILICCKDDETLLVVSLGDSQPLYGVRVKEHDRHIIYNIQASSTESNNANGQPARFLWSGCITFLGGQRATVCLGRSRKDTGIPSSPLFSFMRNDSWIVSQGRRTLQTSPLDFGEFSFGIAHILQPHPKYTVLPVGYGYPMVVEFDSASLEKLDESLGRPPPRRDELQLSNDVVKLEFLEPSDMGVIVRSGPDLVTEEDESDEDESESQKSVSDRDASKDGLDEDTGGRDTTRPPWRRHIGRVEWLVYGPNMDDDPTRHVVDLDDLEGENMMAG